MLQQFQEQAAPVSQTVIPPAAVQAMEAEPGMEITAQEPQTLVLLQEQTRLHRRGQRYMEWQRILRTIIITLLGALTLVSLLNYGVWKVWGQYLFAPLYLGTQLERAFILIGVFSIPGSVLTIQLYKITSQLADTQDLRTVGMLLNLLANGENQPIIAKALQRLLPHLQASDASLLNATQREGLNRELTRSAYRKWFRHDRSVYAVTILKALEQVGDSSALPVVQKLADAPPRQAWPVVRQAARDCLPFLQQRLEQQRAQQTLLRAACIVESAPNMLLRPASTAEDQNAHTLLRADLEIAANERE